MCRGRTYLSFVGTFAFSELANGLFDGTPDFTCLVLDGRVLFALFSKPLAELFEMLVQFEVAHMNSDFRLCQASSPELFLAFSFSFLCFPLSSFLRGLPSFLFFPPLLLFLPLPLGLFFRLPNPLRLLCSLPLFLLLRLLLGLYTRSLLLLTSQFLRSLLLAPFLLFPRLLLLPNPPLLLSS